LPGHKSDAKRRVINLDLLIVRLAWILVLYVREFNFILKCIYFYFFHPSYERNKNKLFYKFYKLFETKVYGWFSYLASDTTSVPVFPASTALRNVSSKGLTTFCRSWNKPTSSQFLKNLVGVGVWSATYRLIFQRISIFDITYINHHCQVTTYQQIQHSWSCC